MFRMLPTLFVVIFLLYLIYCEHHLWESCRYVQTIRESKVVNLGRLTAVGVQKEVEIGESKVQPIGTPLAQIHPLHSQDWVTN